MKTLMKISFVLFIALIFSSHSNAGWQYCGNYTSNIVQMIANDSVLIAGTYGNGVYITSNGINWTYSNSGMTNGEIISFASVGNNIFAGSESGGVYRSSNYGYNWTPVNSGISNITIHWLSSSGGNLYAATSNGVNLSTNNGESWSRISPPSVGTIIFSVQAYSNKIIASSANGVYISSNGGSNWNNISPGLSGYIYCLSYFDNAVYAGSSTSGVFKTTNDGLNWIQMSNELPPGKAVRTISFGDEKIFAAVYNSGGIYYVPLSGNMWHPANQGLTQLSCYTVIKFKNYIFAGTTAGIFKRPSNEFTSIKKIGNTIPNDYNLSQNFPNPFNPVTTIKYSIPQRSTIRAFGDDIVGVVRNDRVLLKVYDILGKEVETLVNQKLNPGNYEVTFDGSSFPSGIYFYSLVTGDFKNTKKMILIK